VITFALILLTGASATAQDDLPVVKGKKIVATVQGEPITLDELNAQLASLRGAEATPDTRRRLAVLDRLIHVALIAQEARRMGLDKLPEVRNVVDSQTRLMLREELVEQAVKNAKGDPKDVQKTYHASVRQWKVSAALFDKEEHARSMAAALDAGKTFGELARTYQAEGKASKVEHEVVLKRGAADPAIGAAVAALAVGATSPVVSTKSGFVIVRLEEILYPDDAVAKARAEQIVLTAARKDALTAFDKALKKKYVKIHRDVLRGIDYEADRPGFEALGKDTRVLAEIKGETPVTVGELTEQLKFKFFHGTAMAAQRKRLNAKKEEVLDGILHRKVFRKEAMRLGLHKTDAYRRKVRDYENSVLFEAALRKVVAPDVELKDDDVKAYYEEHRERFTTPEMMRIKSLVFADRAIAQTALESLRKGGDFQWVASRAEDQLDPNAKVVPSFDGMPVMTSELPEGIRKALTGANAGDVRLYASPENHFYVLSVQQVIAAAPKPFEAVKGEIVKTMLDQKIEQAIADYANKLRSLSDVKVFLKAS
jgi:parvulin-like peptidyl-prolyl isomerase